MGGVTTSCVNDKEQYDVVIIGGGATGLAAGVAAAENGLSAIVLEKRGAPGGNAMFAQGLLGAETHVQKRQMLDVRRDDVFHAAMDYAHWMVNSRIIRAFVDKTAETVKWLEDKGLKFTADNYIPGQKMWTYHKPEGAGPEVIRVLHQNCKDLGVPVLMNTAAKKIIKDDSGKITGVLANDQEKEFIIMTNNVIIGTGGYSGNKEWIKKYFPLYHKDLVLWGLGHNGDGIAMATEAGGANEGLGILQLSGPHVPAAIALKINPADGGEPILTTVSAIAREPYMLWVNKKGERYADEAVGLIGHESVNAVVRQPDITSYSLFDADTVDMITNYGMIKGLAQEKRQREIERSGLPGLAEQLEFQTGSWMYVQNVDREKCNGCGTCITHCPAGGITLDTIVEEKGEFSPCRFTCPAHVDMRSYFYLIKQGKKKEANELLREYLPLPAITGRVCPHLCESECARNDVDEPVSINRIERYLADQWLSEKAQPIPRKHSEKIAVVGSGPAGLSCAYFLTRMGYPVTIFESEKEAGGMLRFGIPEYRLAKDIVEAQIKYIKDMGVELITGVTVGKDISFNEINKEYKSVFYAIGNQLSRKIRIPGCDSDCVRWGLDFLRDVNSKKNVSLDGDVVVVGGGNVAIDVTLTALRLGAKSVQMACLETGDEIPAFKEELEQAKLEGVVINEGWGPNSICSGSIEFIKCTQVFNAEGRFAPIYDNNVKMILKADTVILAIGQAPDNSNDPAELKLGGNGTVIVDNVTFATSVSGIFAGGDIIGGKGSVVKSIADGKEAAISIDSFIRGENLKFGRETQFKKVENPPKDGIDKTLRTPASIKCIDNLVGNFEEVKNGFSDDEAKYEVGRCMTCGSRAVISFSDDCQLCKTCVVNCPTHAISPAPVHKVEPVVKITDNWDDMAAWIGADPEVLKATVNDYNRYCDQGHDEIEAKDRVYLRPVRKPPFYAIKCRAAFLTTIGGIKINERMQVVDKNGDPVPGLYAGGQDTGGWETETYNVVLSGSTFSFAINSARIAVEQIAKSLGERK